MYQWGMIFASRCLDMSTPLANLRIGWTSSTVCRSCREVAAQQAGHFQTLDLLGRERIPRSLQELSAAGSLPSWDQLLAALLFMEGAWPEEEAPQSQSSLSSSGMPGPHPLSTATMTLLQ